MRSRKIAALVVACNCCACAALAQTDSQTSPSSDVIQPDTAPSAPANPEAGDSAPVIEPAPKPAVPAPDAGKGAELPPIVVKEAAEKPEVEKPADKQPIATAPDKSPRAAVAIQKKSVKPKAKQTAKPLSSATPAPSQQFDEPVEQQPATLQQPEAETENESASIVSASQPDGVTLSFSEPYGKITSANSDDVQGTQGGTFTDALKNKPGIASSSFAPGSSRPIVRGLDNTRIRVQEGGLGSGDVSDLSEDHAVPVDPCSIDRVDVISGPAALRTTSKAAGGVVNAETKRIPEVIPERGYAAEVRGGVTSADDGSEGCFNTTVGAGGIAVHSGAFVRRADDYQTPFGRQFNSFVESEGFSAGASLIGLDGFVGISYARFESVYGIPGEEAAEEQPRIDLGQDRLSAKGEWRIGQGAFDALRFWYSYSNYGHSEIIFADGPDAVGSRFFNQEHEGRLEAEHAPLQTSFGEVQGAAGVQISHRDLAGLSVEGDNLIEPGTTNKIAAYLFEEARLSREMRALASLRYEYAKLDGRTITDIAAPVLQGFDRTYNTISGGFGFAYDLPKDVTARATVLHLERAPEAPELFSKGAHEATGTFEIGNPNLDKEIADTIEVGLSRSTVDFRFDVTGYHTWFDGFIVRQLTGETCGETVLSCTPIGGEDELDQAIFVQRDARYYGVELSGEIDVARMWNGVWGVSAQYDFVRASFSDGENVPRIPPHRLGGGMYYRDGVWRADISLLHAFDQDRIAFNETPTEGYTLLSAEVSTRIELDGSGEGKRELILGVRGENLLDDDVRHHTSFKKDEVLQPGIGVKFFGIARF